MSGEVLCPYCGGAAEAVRGDALYVGRHDLARKTFWVCVPCGAHVGCHGDTAVPLGGLANAPLRAVRQRAHAAFDPLWKAVMVRDSVSRKEARGRGYKWLADELGLSSDECHIGKFDIPTCERAIVLCRAFGRKAPG